jgi:hypothetical protein
MLSVAIHRTDLYFSISLYYLVYAQVKFYKESRQSIVRVTIACETNVMLLNSNIREEKNKRHLRICNFADENTFQIA